MRVSEYFMYICDVVIEQICSRYLFSENGREQKTI